MLNKQQLKRIEQDGVDLELWAKAKEPIFEGASDRYWEFKYGTSICDGEQPALSSDTPLENL